MNEDEQSAVSIIIDDENDWKSLKEATIILNDFKIKWEKKIFSGKNSLTEIQNYITNADTKGIKIILIGSSKETDLNLLHSASDNTTLPVLEVSTKIKPIISTILAHNQALLAVRILSLTNAHTKERLADFLKNQINEETAH